MSTQSAIRLHGRMHHNSARVGRSNTEQPTPWREYTVTDRCSGSRSHGEESMWINCQHG